MASVDPRPPSLVDDPLCVHGVTLAAVASEGAEGSRELIGADTRGSEGEALVGDQLGREAEAAAPLDDPIGPELQKEAKRRGVERLDERRAQQDAAVERLGDVARVPIFAWLGNVRLRFEEAVHSP